METAARLGEAPGLVWPRVALFGLLLALHVGVLLLPRQIVHPAHPEPLALIYLPEPKGPSPAPNPSRRSVKTPAASEHAAPPMGPPPAPLGTPPESPRIDWDREAAVTAEHLTQLANAPKRRSLDDHRGHHHQDGVGLNSHEAPEFGWDQTAIHRFDTRGEIPIVRLSERCVLPLGPFIPLPVCGFGRKIEPRGDLFEHMHQISEAPAP